ncbi:LytTR family DNA-binding domain-containing protein [Leptobacterium sp. I13]|uniref:LytR/AlgR family response regulator transcription factor n=1 Tax=Leptobacterium meishanense TaxID=3128904 RepID=UPI0030EF56CF
MRCIAIDDEPMALEIIKDYIEKIPYIKSCHTFTNAIEALAYVQQNRVDLIFLDINMPDLSGIQFLKALDTKIPTILTTAYSEYALQSYDFDVVDYLLKPIAFDRFLKAVQKGLKVLNISNDVITEDNKVTENDFISIKSGSKIYRIKTSEIKYIEGAGNYLSFIMENRKILSLMKMDEAINTLPSYFVRTHKSYIVNTKQINVIENDSVTIGSKRIPISKTYKNNIPTL